MPPPTFQLLILPTLLPKVKQDNTRLVLKWLSPTQEL